MHYLNRLSGKYGDEGVSPVIGVMLMLVVTIIIAAVVSGFSGGLIGGNNQKAPTLTMDVKISNTGSWIGSGFTATVTSVSEPIATKNLKLVTSWKTTNKDTGASLSGGNTSMPLVKNVRSPKIGSGELLSSNAPYGTGSGVNGSTGAQSLTDPYSKPDQQFGNYTLVQGTGLTAVPYGSYLATAIGSATGQSDLGGYGIPVSVNPSSKGPYKYTTVAGYFVKGSLDATQAVLGTGWENLRVGDTVNVRVVYLPTGKVIFDKDVVVTEG
ncbi:type IV pilin N-terminal domain-containing protein [Methanoregula sp.]|uniref:type IV pilin N-terminal domain-containing protein n=1 Tax=Methanoregula sp. TaxID=2052170 RepID=UPI002372A6CA|nr:type IV pilin N-terminal domain-containing protein [Methanoregula sp.]MDD1686444.1 type IV pilin N-terminal domain-containing protein [Methanoregula sp.]